MADANRPYLVSLNELACLTFITHALFDDNHSVRFEADIVPVIIEGEQSFRPRGIICEIFSVAGVLQGRGQTVIEAYADAVRAR
jgi:hypothetical protein